MHVPRLRFLKMHTLQASIGQRPLITVAGGIAPGIVCNWPINHILDEAAAPREWGAVLSGARPVC